ncbi:KilA-N domain-containing protein [Desulfovibrio sp. TomC]|uniref:KilA-N domain-containing protein n=1 Tax=Desulfovibrio sp. TomC TaxID=1562888 RepID=UPI0005BB49B8|nr:KilA-N domain-containing protein [Desulfovibrio sp. TomC]
MRLGLEVSVTFNHPAVLKPAAPIFNLPAVRKPVQVQPVGDAGAVTPPGLPSKFLIGNKLVATNEDGLISLTDLHRASGGQHRNRPSYWLESEGNKAFVAALSKSRDSGLFLQVARGRRGGTYAHWQIALAYAKYLSPELHMQVNEVFMRYKTGDALTS